MSGEGVTLEKAIASIRSAADELSAEEFIDYSVILDVHLTWAREELSPDDQYELLKVLAEVLDSHKDLAQSIAWDLVIVLLPFLESPLLKVVEAAELLIRSAAESGNPREVYIKVLQGLSTLAWTPEEDSSDDGYGDPEYSDDDEATALQESIEKKDPAVFAACSLKKYECLLSALETVHPKISARFPSRFLSTELTTLLMVFTKALEAVEKDAVIRIMRRLLSFLGVIRPQLAQAGRLRAGQRPPLPPRTSTAMSTATSESIEQQLDAGAEEDQLQARLIASFLTHILSGFLLRTQQQQQRGATHSPIEPEIYERVILDELGDSTDRGLEVGWAGNYDDQVLRPNKSKVPGGQTLIDLERGERNSNSDVKVLIDDISTLCETLGLKSEELLNLCQPGTTDAPDGQDDDGTDIQAPNAASDVPLSRRGALFLLAHRFSSDPSSVGDALFIYPQHSSIAETFMIYGQGQSQPAVIDAILFLGLLSLQTSGLGEVPESNEQFFIYLQIFSVISTNARSPQARFLANSHVARCLRAHPNEAVRLAYVRDTLEHCPFQSVKAAVVGILKDEILHATLLEETSSAPRTPDSIFGTGACLEEIFDVLFPDLEEMFGGTGSEEKAWELFKEIYPCIGATVNLYLLLLLNNDLGTRLRATNKKFREKVDARYLQPVRKRLEVFKAREQGEGRGGNVMVLEMTMDRVDELKGGIAED